ncbi:MAG: hypothetical protein HQ581_09660 [Planctomycetes bacterium]|nr:hypothetical protein [Planctomycetota bacterium]
MSDKIILTNQSQLKKKYGNTAALDKALKGMIAADKQRGIATTVVHLDDAAQMKKYGGKAVMSAGSASQNKAAIDAVYNKADPDYLMILGATDVIPYVPLKNTMPGDGDPYAYGDLPYACNAKYSTDPSQLTGPTRVLGRLPDLVGGNDTSYVTGLIKAAAGYKSRPANDYSAYFGITAEVWHASTALSLQNTFGNSTNLHDCPSGGPTWTAAQFKPRSHFVNCHGSAADPNFYGQKGSSYPISLSAADIAKKGLSDGAVATVECCYGAELYDPSLSAGQPGICNTFLREGGYGFFGSTTIAYGPAAGNGAADLITQYFLQDVLAGASLGRAALQARQKFVQNSGTMNPVDLKTLSQFYLLGDPSVHPVTLLQAHTVAADNNLMKGLVGTVINLVAHRANRRRQLISAGLSLVSSIACARLSKTIKPGMNVAKALKRIASNLNLTDFDISSFSVSGSALPKSVYAKAAPKRVYHLIHGEAKKPVKAPITPRIAVVVEEQSGKIISLREYYKR